MRLELDLDFSAAFDKENFFFGVANAPYLSEGGYNYPDGIKNSYAVLELGGHIEPSKESTRYWTDYERQIKMAADLGLTAFRMGVDWARIQPEYQRMNAPGLFHQNIGEFVHQSATDRSFQSHRSLAVTF